VLIRLLQATIHLVSSDQGKSSVFKVKVVIVKVHTLKFYSKHNFFYKTFKPLVTRLIKKQIEKAIKDLITTGMEYVDGQLVGVRDRMASAKATEGESRTKVLQDVRIAPFCSCLNRFRFADAVHLFYIDVQEKGRDFHSLPPVVSGTRSSRSCIISGTRSWTLGILLGGSIARRSARILPSMAGIGGLKCTCSHVIVC